MLSVVDDASGEILIQWVDEDFFCETGLNLDAFTDETLNGSLSEIGYKADLDSLEK
jgi:hypothetical protein